MEEITKPLPFKFTEYNVYSANDIMQYDPIYFKGVPDLEIMKLKNILLLNNINN